MLIKSSIEWPDGRNTSRVIDFDDHKAVKRFANVSRTALYRGAKVTTLKVDHTEVTVTDPSTDESKIDTVAPQRME